MRRVEAALILACADLGVEATRVEGRSGVWVPGTDGGQDRKVAAISCGIHGATPVLDLDYSEDSSAGCDGNFVLTGDGKLVEAQITAEGECFDEEELLRLLRLARIGCAEIFVAQDKATGR